LRDRPAGELGARFTKWRAVSRSATDCRRTSAFNTNAHALRPAAPQAGLNLPRLPDLLMCGVAARALRGGRRDPHRAFAALTDHSGARSMSSPRSVRRAGPIPEPVDDRAIADARQAPPCRAVPAAIPGIAFLSAAKVRRPRPRA
jgi:hypothetical protein